MGNFQKYWSQNVGQDFIVLYFFVGGISCGRKSVCGRLMSPAHETQSMREIRLLRGRFPRKGGGLTGMDISEILSKVVLNTITLTPHLDKTNSNYRINIAILWYYWTNKKPSQILKKCNVYFWTRKFILT